MTVQKILTRNFLLAFFAQIAMSAVYHMFIPTLPIYLSRLGCKEVEIGILIGSLGVSSLVLRPFVGRSLIRIPEKNFMIAGSILFALTSISYFVAVPFWPFLIVRVFQGMGFAFFYTAALTLIGNISPEAHRGQSLSYFYLAFNISFALAPSFGMLIINHLNFTVLFLFCAVIALNALLITSRLAKKPVHLTEGLSTTTHSFLSRKAVPPSIMIFFAHIIWGALTAFFPLYALDQGVKNPGIFFAAYACVLILGRAFGGKILDLYSREKIILPCLSMYIISMVLLTFSKTLSMFILVAVIWGAGNAFLIPTLVAYTFDVAGSSRGPAMGTFTAIGDMGTGMGSVIMGIVLRYSNYPIMFLCLALTGFINLIYFLIFIKKRQQTKLS